MPKFNGNEALFEHMLEGHPISLPEAILMFGVQGPNRALYQFKERGYIIKSRKVTMAKVMARMNEYMVCQPPAQLPYKEIFMTEYWIQQ